MLQVLQHRRANAVDIFEYFTSTSHHSRKKFQQEIFSSMFYIKTTRPSTTYKEYSMIDHDFSLTGNEISE